MENMYGIKYSQPEVVLLQDTGIGVAETAARTCYDSFSNSENGVINYIEENMPDAEMRDEINDIEESNLLGDLAWTYFHHSILEHANLSFLVRGTSRGVLQEHARHRIQAISVRSTRYTMSSIINAFVAAQGDKEFFIEKILSFDMFVTCDNDYNKLEISAIFDKLAYQQTKVENFDDIAIAKSSLIFLQEFKANSQAMFEALQTGKKKRNVGDAFKHIITDNVKVDMVVTFNLRSLKNYFTLRDSGAAYFQIRWLDESYSNKISKSYSKKEVKNV